MNYVLNSLSINIIHELSPLLTYNISTSKSKIQKKSSHIYLGLISNWGCKREYLASSETWVNCVFTKCLAAPISSTVTTHGWVSKRGVALTVQQRPASTVFSQFINSFASVRRRPPSAETGYQFCSNSSREECSDTHN